MSEEIQIIVSASARQAIEMIDLGYPTAFIVEDIGIKPGSIATAMRRAGRTDLAVRFERLRNRQKMYPCSIKGCAGKVWSRRSKWCVDHVHQHQQHKGGRNGNRPRLGGSHGTRSPAQEAA